MHTLRKLIRDVPNPKHDGRRKYSIQAIKQFKAGTILKVWPPSKADPWTLVEVNDHHAPRDLSELLLEASVLVVAATKDEVLAKYDFSAKFSDELLDRLVAKGIVTLAQLDEACAEMKADYDTD